LFYWAGVWADKAWRIIDRFGGIEVVDNGRVTPEGLDDIYLRSLSLRPKKDIVYAIRALEPCREYSYACMLQDSAGINLYLISTGIVLTDVDDFLKKYSAEVEFFEGACPVVYETTTIVKELAILRKLKNEKAQLVAKDRMKKIYIDGGLTYSLLTPACRAFFEKKPYMAQAYIGHLAILMRFASDGLWVPGMFLSGSPRVRSIMNGKNFNSVTH
jgi:hypothetical protein